MKKYAKGFTLIELLVVIAVIGILASVALYAADASRKKGIDATIVADMRTISQRVEFRFLNDFSGNYGTAYSGPCNTPGANAVFNDPTIQQAVTAIQKLSGSYPTCMSTTLQWAVSAPLKQGGYWCIETEGKAKKEASPITGTFCP